MTNAPAHIEERLKRIADEVVGLPTLPPMLARMNQLMMDPGASAADVAKLLSSDPALASKVLRVVNSAFYGLANRVATVTHAIVILGFNTIRNIVLGSSIFEQFKGDSGGLFDRTQFWKHSIACGAAARALGRRLGQQHIEELFVAGLLHDIGKVVEDQHLHEQFVQALTIARDRDCLLVAAEEQVLGVTHAEVGALLLGKWNLSKGMVEVVRCHHNPSVAAEGTRTATAIVHFADILARALRVGSGGDRKIPIVSDAAWQVLGLPLDQMDAIVTEAGEEIERAMFFLDFIR